MRLYAKVERYKAVRAKGKEVSSSESRSRLLLSSCSTDQFYNYVTDIKLNVFAGEAKPPFSCMYFPGFLFPSKLWSQTVTRVML